MKESIGNVWITGLVITFMLIFTGYLAVTISYSSTVKSKNYILSIIEKKNGINSFKAQRVKSVLRSGKEVYNGFGSLDTINLFLRGSSYKQKGSCGEGRGDGRGANTDTGIVWYGVYDLYNKVDPIDGNDTVDVKYEKVTNSSPKYYYCFAKIKVDNGFTPINRPLPAYYRVRLFYALELPIVDSLVFTIDGKTDIVESPSRCEIKEVRDNNVSCSENRARFK